MSITQWVDKAWFNGSPYFGNALNREDFFLIMGRESWNKLHHFCDGNATAFKLNFGNMKGHLAV